MRAITPISPKPDNIESPRTDLPKFISNQLIVTRPLLRTYSSSDSTSSNGSRTSSSSEIQFCGHPTESTKKLEIVCSKNRPLLKTRTSSSDSSGSNNSRISPLPNIQSGWLCESRLQVGPLDTQFCEESKCDNIMLNIRFFFSKEKNRAVKNIRSIAETDFDQSEIRKYGRNLLWLIGRQFCQLSCPNNKSNEDFPVNVKDLQNVYTEALLGIVSFQFVIGQKFIPPVFTLGNVNLDTQNPRYCNDPRNQEYKMVVIDREETRKFIADLLLLFHIKSDIGDEKITLICGELLQRAGKDNYRGIKFMLIKFIYQSQTSSPKIESFILSIVNHHLSKSMFEYCLTSKENYDKYVDWITNY